MLIILPEEGHFGQVENRLGADLLDEVSGSLTEGPVELTMPRFDVDGNLKLVDLLKSLGLRFPLISTAPICAASREKSNSTSTKRCIRPLSPSTRRARRRPRPQRSWPCPQPAEGGRRG